MAPASLDTMAYAYDPYGVPTLTENSGDLDEPIIPYQFKGEMHGRITNRIKFGHCWPSVGEASSRQGHLPRPWTRPTPIATPSPPMSGSIWLTLSDYLRSVVKRSNLMETALYL